MTFTTIGRIVAILACLGGLLLTVTGIDIAWRNAPPGEIANRLGSGTPGQMIDRGIYIVLFGLCLGVATDISRRLSK